MSFRPETRIFQKRANTFVRSSNVIIQGEHMNRIATTTLAVLIAVFGLASTPSSAAGVKAGLGKQLWKFNVISLPANSNWADSNASCNGARIFFKGSSGGLTWAFDPNAAQNFEITDCNGTDGSALVTVDEHLEVDIAVRLLGPNNSTLNLVCTEVKDDGLDDNFCVVDSVTITKQGRTSFRKILSTVSDGAYEEYLWTLSGDWKIFDVRVFAK
jgi:hypothetical protein